MIKNNKHGWIRIFEAVFAIMLIAGMLLTLVARRSERQDMAAVMHDLTHPILEEIATNESMRDAVLAVDNAAVNNALLMKFISERLPLGLRQNFNISICNPLEICKPSLPSEAEIYVDDIVISSSLSRPTGPPKKLSLYVWLE